MTDYPTPDQQFEGDNARVQRIVGDVRGAFATSRGTDPVFDEAVNIESVVRFVLLRAVPRCDQCRFWKDAVGAFWDGHALEGWKDCAKAQWVSGEDDRKVRLDTQGWDSDGGAVMTRADFGCVQFEMKA